jgi:hypothetical protein
MLQSRIAATGSGEKKEKGFFATLMSCHLGYKTFIANL